MANTKKNWLLTWGIFCCSIYVFIVVFFPFESSDTASSRDITGNHFFITFIGAVMIAPLLEEVTFRGFFTGKKWLKIFSLILIPVMVLGTGNINFLSVTFAVIFYALILIQSRIGTSIRVENLLMVCSALIFAVLHWELSDFHTIQMIFPIIVHFGVGFILLWITINFSLLKAIFFHACYNSFLLLLLFSAIQFPDGKWNHATSENLIVEWKMLPLINQMEMQIGMNKKNDSLWATDIQLPEIAEFMCGFTENEYKKPEMVQEVPFARYQIKIYLKETSEIHDLQEVYPELKSLLQQEELLYH